MTKGNPRARFVKKPVKLGNRSIALSDTTTVLGQGTDHSPSQSVAPNYRQPWMARRPLGASSLQGIHASSHGLGANATEYAFLMLIDGSVHSPLPDSSPVAKRGSL